MLTISFPENFLEERRWISSVVFDEFLGIDYDIIFDHRDTVRISADGKLLTLPDTFFQKAKRNWLATDTLPRSPLQSWTASEHGLCANLVKPSVPVIFGEGRFEIKQDRAYLGLDVFGSAFFMLSRYEEAINTQRDRHARFPSAASLAYQAGFLDRPLIDEYVEILWCAITSLWPQARRRLRRYRTVVSCDVDRPYHSGAMSVTRMARATVGQAIRQRRFSAALAPVMNYLAVKRGDFRRDPFYFTVDWMMDVNEKAGNKVVFNFIPEVTDPNYDGDYEISSQPVNDMLRRIHRRGHEVGLHPGYQTYQSIQRTRSALKTLRRALRQSGVSQSIAGGRNHYLRWSTQTPAVWDACGLYYDSTLGYADRAGFRCGTCREYSMFDLHARKPLSIKQRPLVCMDCSVVDYMGYGFTEAALDQMVNLKKAAQKLQGDFTLLWHNSYLENESAKEIYLSIIR